MTEFDVCVLLNGWGGLGGTSIVDSLRYNTEKRKIRIICADMVERCALRHKADAFYILPPGNSSQYLRHLLDLCKKENIDVIMPGSGPEIRTISMNLDQIKLAGAHPTIDNYEHIKPLLNKAKTYKALETANIAVPKFVHITNTEQIIPAINNVGYPSRHVCFKPSKYENTGGARGFKILRKSNTTHTTVFNSSSAEIDYNTVIRLAEEKKKTDLLVMEYLPGLEFSVYVFADSGKMLYCVPNLRERLVCNYSFEASTVDLTPEIQNICRMIVKLFDLSYNVNIQLKKSYNGKLKVVEINPRMGGSIVLPVAAGINMPYLAIKMALGEYLPRDIKYRNVKMTRYLHDKFINAQQDSFEIS